MPEQETYIDTPDGRMDTFVTYPLAEGRHSAVLFYMDAPGIREELRAMARRIAAKGYFVLLPNLYYRQTKASAPDYVATPLNERIHYARHISNRLVMRDTEAMLDYIENHPRVNASPVGAVGFCMSGAFVLLALVSVYAVNGSAFDVSAPL